jgi:hypothetical protein
MKSAKDCIVAIASTSGEEEEEEDKSDLETLENVPETNVEQVVTEEADSSTETE